MSRNYSKVFRIEQSQEKASFAGSNDVLQNKVVLQLLDEVSQLRSEMKAFFQNKDASSSESHSDTEKLLSEIRSDLSQAQKLKAELDEIHNAIGQTRQELATLHFTGFSGTEMECVNNELEEIVSGTERATNAILEAAEAIDENANALQAACKKEHDKSMAADIQDKIVAIFEACNFQDLTGQRITKIVRTLEFIEHRITKMVDIWGGLETLNSFVPEAPELAKGDAALLNGPKQQEADGHVSQNDIDALFA